jgi:DNA helicase IV
MSSSKPTYREYKLVADRLKRLNDDVSVLYKEKAEREGKKAIKSLYIGMMGLDTARNMLEENFFRDYPEYADTHVFYGRGEQK